ncbi:uncharacterized protein LOC106011970 [Aplysia californica]|uniref:Uncharacterized protein LOC106011970 n=1 Tax=Aplysia californica TaxID=6500 RepID=A0ABM1A1E1_APLCA|nr:uncharacterized protein LOC106011970 [Aplysia californica]
MHSETFSTTDASTYYVTLWNTDATTDQSSTYHFSCAVVTTTSSGVYMTTYPNKCLNSTYQNSSYISESTGFTIVVSTNSTCVPSESTDIGLIIGIVVAVLFIIGIAILVGYLIYVYCYLPKQGASARPGSKVVPDTLPNTAMSQADKNKRMMFTPAPPKSAGPGKQLYGHEAPLSLRRVFLKLCFDLKLLF